MDLVQLKYFETAAKHEHITHAANELHIAQPSLSKVISRLEDELGVMLFDRQGRNIRLNSYGRAFLRRVKRIFLEIEDGKRELADMSGLEQGKISLALTSLSLLPKILEGFLRAHPDVSFHQVLASTSEMKRKLEDGTVDLCIASPPIEGPDVICTPLVTEEVFLAVPKEHRLSGRGSIDLSEVATETFISMKQGYGFRDITDEFCRQAGFTPNVVFEGDVTTTLLSLVNSGLGITFVPSPNLREFSVQLPVLLHISKPVCQRTISLAYMEGHYLSKAARQFCRYVAAYFEENSTVPEGR